MINTQLLLGTLEFIVAHPERWNQEDFRDEQGRCCFVGLAAEVAGQKWASDADDEFNSFYLENGEMVSRWAEKEFGLEYSDFLRLIWGRNTLERLKELVSEFIIKSVDHDIAELREKVDNNPMEGAGHAFT